jgi:hypothetical protein
MNVVVNATASLGISERLGLYSGLGHRHQSGSKEDHGENESNGKDEIEFHDLESETGWGIYIDLTVATSARPGACQVDEWKH